MVRRRTLTLAAAAALAAMVGSSGAAQAQHAKFVLFGQPSSEAQLMPPESRFVLPITDAYFNESSHVTSDVRLTAAYQSFPNSLPFGQQQGTDQNGNPVTFGAGLDHAMIYSLQARVALTSQFQLMLYKSGYTDFDGPGTDDAGWNDLGIGIKWNFLQDWGNNLHAAAGVGYEFAIGDPSVFNNDDEVRVWASIDKGFGRWHVGGTINARFGDDTFGSDLLSFHGRVDYYVNEYFSPVVELNYYRPMSTASPSNPARGVPQVGDIGNFDSANDMMTLGVGAEVRPIKDLGIRAAYEFPLTSNSDIYGWRMTASIVYAF